MKINGKSLLRPVDRDEMVEMGGKLTDGGFPSKIYVGLTL